MQALNPDPKPLDPLKDSKSNADPNLPEFQAPP